MRHYKIARFVQDKSNGEWVERFESYYENLEAIEKAKAKTLAHYQTLFGDEKRYRYWVKVTELKYNFIKCQQCNGIHRKSQWHEGLGKFLCQPCYDNPQPKKEYIWHGKQKEGKNV